MNTIRAGQFRSKRSRRQDGTAVLIILALLAILLTYVGFNLATLRSLERNVKLLEHRQLVRLSHVVISTNSIPATNGLTVSSESR